MPIHRSSLLVHSETVNLAGAGTRAFYQPENLVDYSAGSESGVTFALDVHGVVGTADDWYLTAKFQLGIGDVAGAGWSQQRWFDLQPEQIAKLVAEGVDWYGGAAEPITRQNLFTNPSVETGGWTGEAGTGGAVAVSRPADGGYAGPTYYRVTWTTAPTVAGAGGIKAWQFACTGGELYSAGMYVRPSKAQRLKAQIVWYDAANVILSTVSGVVTEVPTGAWTRVAISGQLAPATATYGTVRVLPDATGPIWAIGDTLDGDAIMANVGATLLPYFDGASPGAVWDATAHASSSTMTITGSIEAGVVARKQDQVAIFPASAARTIRGFGRYVRLWIQPHATNPSSDFAVRYSLTSSY